MQSAVDRDEDALMHTLAKDRSCPSRGDERAKARLVTLRDVDRALLRDLYHVLVRPASAGTARLRR